MVKTKQGDILKSSENIIIHQVNCQGYMGGGIARQLANQYKGLEKEYSEYCKIYMFSQKENFDTDYEAMKIALEEVKEYAKEFKLSIAIPYRNRLWNSKWRLEESL